MLLIITNSQDVTADYLAVHLKKHSINYLRLNTDTILEQVVVEFDGLNCHLCINDDIYRPENFLNVWYRRPERLHHDIFSDDTAEGKFILDEWSEALEGFFSLIEPSKWINHPSCNVMASHKIEQLLRAKSAGLQVPDSLVTQNAVQLCRFSEKHGGRIITKPMGTGYLKRSEGEKDSLVYTNQVSPEHLDNLDCLTVCPTLFQEEVYKLSDIRITVVDHHLHAVKLTANEGDGSQRCDIRRNNMADVQYEVFALPDSIKLSLRNLLSQYKLRYAAIDMAITLEGEWIFFEVNPNGQWAWMDLLGVTDIAMSFVDSFKGKRGKQ